MTVPDVVELTRALVAMDTINPPGNEARCGSYLAELLDAAGFRVEMRSFGVGRANLVARVGSETGGKPLCFTGHLDTVPLGNEDWAFDPFGGEIAEGRVYGRGTTDMKGGVAAMALAAINLAPKLEETAGVVLVFTGGEETGCDGAKALCAAPETLGRAGAIVAGEPTSNKPLIGHKGALWLNAVARGITAHGSTPELGVNAVYAACRAVAKLEDFGFNLPPHEVMGGPSLNVGRMKGGINVNSVPDYAEFDIDIRTVPGQRHDHLRGHLEGYLEGEVALSAMVDVGAVISDPEDAWIQDVFWTLRTMFAIGPQIATAKYFTDASVLTPAYGNPPTLVLGPGEAAIAHKTNEYCEVAKLYQAVEIYEAIVRRWCGLE
jgi:succinyl-diaminopimelate desuccinylase